MGAKFCDLGCWEWLEELYIVTTPSFSIAVESFLDLSTTYLYLGNRGTKYLEDRSRSSSSTVMW